MERNARSDPGDKNRLYYCQRHNLHARHRALVRNRGEPAGLQGYGLLAGLAEILFRSGRRNPIADRHDQGRETPAERGNRGNLGRRHGEARYRVCAKAFECL